MLFTSSTVSLRSCFMHCGGLLFEVTQRVPFPLEMLSGIGNKEYISAFSRSITFPDLAGYANNAPMILRLTCYDNGWLSFFMEIDLVVSLKLTNRHRFTGLWNNDVLFTKRSFRKSST